MTKEYDLKEWNEKNNRYEDARYIAVRLYALIAERLRFEEKKNGSIRNNELIEKLREDKQLLIREGKKVSPNDNETMDKMLGYENWLKEEEEKVKRDSFEQKILIKGSENERGK